MKASRGQTLYYFVVFTMILVLSWAMMLNIAKVIRDRMILQNTADNLALSLATYKARVLNFLGNTNYMMGAVLSLGMNPRGIQLASYSTDIVGGMPATMSVMAENPLSDLVHRTTRYKKDDGARTIKGFVDILQKSQDAVLQWYAGYYARIISHNFSKDYSVVVTPVIKDITDPAKYVGLKRNSKGIQYYSTETELCEYLGYVMHFHLVTRKKFRKTKYSWLVQDRNFHEQKIQVILTHKEKKSYPLFAKLLNIKYPQIVVYSAAAPYNTKGPMFPEKEDTFTGATPLTVSLVEGASLMQFGIMERALANIAGFGPAAAVAAALAEIAVAANYAESKKETYKLFQSGRDNPIDAYLKAKNGGWGAHLVPYRYQKNDNDNDGD